MKYTKEQLEAMEYDLWLEHQWGNVPTREYEELKTWIEKQLKEVK